MIISYTKCGNYEAFLCVPRGVSWRLEVDIESMGSFSEEEGDDFTNYCVRVVTGDGMSEIVVNHEEYLCVDGNFATDDEMFELCNLIVSFAALDLDEVLEKEGNHFDLNETVEKALTEWKFQLKRRREEA